MKNKSKSPLKIILVLVFSMLFSQAVFVAAQTQQEDVDKLRIKAAALMKLQRYVDALPILEQIIIADPEDGTAHFYFGFSLLSKAADTADAAERKKLRVRALKAFVKAKDLGDDSQLLAGLIQSIPSDGSEPGKYSQNIVAEEFMRIGEAAFANGKNDEALAAYQNALQADPKIYEAALYSGDVHVQTGKFDLAETWYQKAITIDPYRETAYRYSATPLMKQEKYEQARNRYIEAFITEPYSRFALQGLIQWAEITGNKLGHPLIEPPEFKVGQDGKSESTITFNPDNENSISWIGYTATRSEWLEKKFAKTFPNEKTYRHSLQEEAEALRSVLKIAKEMKGKNKKTDPQIQRLMDLEKDDLLEAFILMALPDEGIAQDHNAYLRNNRDKLRQYVLKYVVKK